MGKEMDKGPNAGNVIPLAGLCGDARFRALREVEAYWQALRGGRGIPRRADIDPRGIENALEYAFILERIAPGLARLRIAGMHLSELMGMEVRGMPVSAFVAPAGRTDFAQVLDEVTAGPAAARISLLAEGGVGKPALEGRMLLLPLQSDLGDISRVLGCLETLGPIGRAPRRFNVMKTELRPIPVGRQPFGEEARPARPARPAPGRTMTGADGFGEAAGRFGDRRPGYLRLVTSDE